MIGYFIVAESVNKTRVISGFMDNAYRIIGMEYDKGKAETFTVLNNKLLNTGERFLIIQCPVVSVGMVKE